MLRLDGCLLGRWGHRDFLRGRTKRGGAVHTRHTHGCQGRYKRLSNNFGLRDGRRHAWNHMKGGLGVKLGGGLFGLRIPRQHSLSTMSRDEYEIATHGHPNITNPYRHYMEEHPDLRGVMQNASLDVRVVLLMPRVPRVVVSTAADEGGEVPSSWKELLQHVGNIIRGDDNALTRSDGGISSSSSNGDRTTTYFATMSASVACGDARRDSMQAAAVSLFKDLMRGTKVHPVSSSMLGQRHGRRRIPLLGTSLARAALPQTPSSSALHACVTEREAPRVLSHDSETKIMGCSISPSSSFLPSTSTSHVVAQRGVEELLQDLQQSYPYALNLCLRLEELLHTTTTTGDDDGDNNKVNQGEMATLKPVKSMRKLLREDVDPDEVGVWKTPTATVDALMRWQYFNWDPRAHSKDGLPHHRRLQPVHIFVDASRLQGKKRTKSAGNSNATRSQSFRVRSLMPLRFSEKLKGMNFKHVSHKDLHETLTALRRWSVDFHWRALEERRKTLTGEKRK